MCDKIRDDSNRNDWQHNWNLWLGRNNRDVPQEHYHHVAVVSHPVETTRTLVDVIESGYHNDCSNENQKGSLAVSRMLEGGDTNGSILFLSSSRRCQ